VINHSVLISEIASDDVYCIYYLMSLDMFIGKNQKFSTSVKLTTMSDVLVTYVRGIFFLEHSKDCI
jgi:hypothetical protein